MITRIMKTLRLGNVRKLFNKHTSPKEARHLIDLSGLNSASFKPIYDMGIVVGGKFDRKELADTDVAGVYENVRLDEAGIWIIADIDFPNPVYYRMLANGTAILDVGFVTLVSRPDLGLHRAMIVKRLCELVA